MKAASEGGGEAAEEDPCVRRPGSGIMIRSRGCQLSVWRVDDPPKETAHVKDSDGHPTRQGKLPSSWTLEWDATNELQFWHNSVTDTSVWTRSEAWDLEMKRQERVQAREERSQAAKVAKEAAKMAIMEKVEAGSSSSSSVRRVERSWSREVKRLRDKEQWRMSARNELG